MDRARRTEPVEGQPARSPDEAEEAATEHGEDESARKPNPPHTTTKGITLPKFGSGGSGGAEIEPGPERD